MQTTLLLLVKIGLLLLLWFFIWMTLRSLKKETDRVGGAVGTPGVAGVAGAGLGAAGAGGAVGTPGAAGPGPMPAAAPASHDGAGHGFRRHKAPTSLEIVSGPLTGTTLELKGYTEVTIGRSSTCTLVLEDDFASGTHARLIHRGNEWFVEDVDSRNGTWIGPTRIDQPEKLHAGMEIRVGQTHVRMDA
ncbi:MAG TPA: FHA domain-containing protein [Candidatus Corynebacterium gallistercoris]|uniref:FHA domain-containing protein n=1 Tax=Candidatus Corynebacterium gallistercoris TaxID=2838530 RepID=A0A9D1RXL0_9CORY|nr:FHA domain-containing protein [Candidatus Corynebacterium gallistercoris]